MASPPPQTSRSDDYPSAPAPESSTAKPSPAPQIGINVPNSAVQLPVRAVRHPNLPPTELSRKRVRCCYSDVVAEITSEVAEDLHAALVSCGSCRRAKIQHDRNQRRLYELIEAVRRGKQEVVEVKDQVNKPVTARPPRDRVTSLSTPSSKGAGSSGPLRNPPSHPPELLCTSTRRTLTCAKRSLMTAATSATHSTLVVSAKNPMVIPYKYRCDAVKED